MEAKINIAEILESKSQGTKLYSLTYGDCFYQEYTGDFGIECQSQNGVQFNLDEYGKYYIDGECIIFPSKEMRDWSKFAWKKGDVLVCKDYNSHIIFEKFNDDTYTTFTGKLYYQATKAGYSYAHTRNLVMTQDFDIEKGDAAQTYISTIEERLGGKLNRETLEIEKYQPEFNDGDVVVVDEIPFDLYSKCIFILKENLNTGEIKARAYVLYNVNKDCIFFDTYVTKVIERNIHLATDEEKQQLFDALAKEGKAWDAEKKQIVDLKPKVEFKPFDRVLCRDGVGKEWHIDLFESVLTDNSEYNYKCMVNVWKICIPYKGNEYLLGTTNNVEG